MQELRQRHPEISLCFLCSLFDVSRQAYYEAQIISERTSVAHMLVLTLIHEWRDDMPLLGIRKLFYLLTPELEKHNIKMGRDQLFELLRFHGLLIRRRRTKIIKTTDSNHWMKKYPNRIIDLTIDAPEQLWITDITYIRTIDGFNYLSLVTDAYSRKIIGHCLHETLEAIGCEQALALAIASRTKMNRMFPTIHHSDRGTQYCSANYTQMLKDGNIDISMTQSGSPYENAMAERVNGIIKNEFFPKVIYKNHQQAQKAIEKIIDTYNTKRPHLSLNYQTPDEAHNLNGEIKKAWKNYPRKHNKKPALIEDEE
ncbi:IS3 family transposase [Arachidicoccus sp.]|uniref:IS3 family transposase n=1 Tax=Arachidicoccus sp. TaxID=1872624 RepID=UPI003D22E56D